MVQSLEFKDLDRRLRALGYAPISRNGSHIKYTNGDKQAIIPWKSKEVPFGVVMSLKRQIGVNLLDRG